MRDIQRGESHQWEHIFAADQTSLLAVILDYLMHHCDAQACEKNTTRVLQTIAEWGREMATSLVSSQNILGGFSVCSFDRTRGAAVMNFSKVSC